MAKEAIIIESQSGDWEGVYVNGKLVDEDHTLGEGDRFYWSDFLIMHDLKKGM